LVYNFERSNGTSAEINDTYTSKDFGEFLGEFEGSRLEKLLRSSDGLDYVDKLMIAGGVATFSFGVLLTLYGLKNIEHPSLATIVYGMGFIGLGLCVELLRRVRY
jgi:hypothetical protein